MKMAECTGMRRRDFLSSASLLVIGAATVKASPFSSQSAIKGPDLPEMLSAAEAESVKDSIMATDMSNFWGKGYSCAETGFAVALRFMEKPEDLVAVAGGFGGGMMHQDLCGFLTAGIMAIGLQTGSMGVEKNVAKERCSRLVNDYWDWWVSNAPLHCSDIREGREDFKVCHRLGQLAAVRLERLLKT